MPGSSLKKRSPERTSAFSSGDYMETPARHLMTPGVVMIPEDAGLRHVYRAMTAHGVRAVLVIGRADGNPLGWVTARGLLDWVGKDEALASARDAIIEQPTGIDPSATAREALAALSQPGVSHLLVRKPGDSVPEGVISELDLVALEGE